MSTPNFSKSHEDLQSTLGRLFPAFQTAVDDAREYRDSNECYDGSFFSHQVRYLSKVNLKKDGIEAEDCELEDTANSGLCIVLPGYRIRVLRSADGEIPDPGTSERRKRFLSQEPEGQYKLPFEGSSGNPAPTVPVEKEPLHLVLLWETDAEKFFTGFWMICPNGMEKPFFKEWLALPQAPAVSPIEPESPPEDLEGFTRKIADQPLKSNLPKTGTDEGE